MSKTIRHLALFPAALALASCTSAANGDTAPPSTPAVSFGAGGEAVELPDGSPFTARSHASFSEPWALAIEPGTGNIFVTEKGGTARFYQPATGRIGTITGLPEVAYGGQGGLGDFAFAPDYTTSGTVYLSWAQAAEGKARRAAVGKARLVCEASDSCTLQDLAEIWRQSVDVESNGHFSHRIAFSPDGQYLFVSSGDRQQQSPAQDLSNNLGSVVRLNLDGSPAAGNPFADQGPPTDQIWSYGHRNLLGLQFDLDGQLWDVEHGPAGGDELNKVEPGNNYGWPVRSNGDNYNGSDIPDHTADDGFAKPAISWNPVIAPGDFIFYDGAQWPEWRGQALIANLRTTSISRVAIAADDSSAEEVARYDFPKRLRGIAQALDGSLWVIEDGDGGRLLHLTPAG